MNRLLALSAASIAFTSVASFASAAVLIDQNFENQTTFPAGTAISISGSAGDASTTAGLWRTRDVNGTPNPTPSVDPDNASNHAVLITRQAGARPTFSGARDTVVSDALFSYEFSFRLNGATHISGNEIDFIATIGTATDAITGVNPGSIYLGVNDLRYHSGSAFTTVTGTTLAAETWHHAKVEINATTPAAATMNLYVNGNQVLNAASIGSLVSIIDSIDRITFVAQGTQGRSFYIDDVRLESIPEPAGMALLGAAGAILLRRKRTV